MRQLVRQAQIALDDHVQLVGLLVPDALAGGGAIRYGTLGNALLQDMHGRTPLHYALMKCQSECEQASDRLMAAFY